MENRNSVPAQFWRTLDDGRIECQLCPRFCHLRDGQQGLCFVRSARDGQMWLDSYGRSSGFCVDPIEKKPLNHFYPGTPVLSFGTAGCNLACKFCQNWDISKSRDTDRLARQASPVQLVSAARQTGSRSIAFTYNDPVIFYEYAIDVADACREQNVHSVAVSAGYVCEAPREGFFSRMDAANIDLKAFDQKFYKYLCGGELQNVLDTLRYIRHETNCWLEITTLLIPGENDSDQELTAMCEWIVDALGKDIPLHFTAFHPDWKMREHPRTPLSTLQRARNIARAAGLHYVYTGNVHDSDGSSTYCSSCSELLIERDWYELGQWNLQGERCRHCDTVIAGRFDKEPGDWGAKRMPISIR